MPTMPGMGLTLSPDPTPVLILVVSSAFITTIVSTTDYTLVGCPGFQSHNFWASICKDEMYGTSLVQYNKIRTFCTNHITIVLINKIPYKKCHTVHKLHPRRSVMIKCMGLVWYNIPKNCRSLKRFFFLGGAVSTLSSSQILSRENLSSHSTRSYM